MMFYHRRKAVICGLKNHHNVCYINSVVQSLFSCKSFVRLLEEKQFKEGSVFFQIKKIWEDMKNKEILDKRPLYKELAEQSGDLFRYDNQPGYTENFLEFLILNLEQEMGESHLFLDENNFEEKHKEKVFLKNSDRHIILLSRISSDHDNYIQSIINYISSQNFKLPYIIIISLGPIYKTKPNIHIPSELNIRNFNYDLQSIICRKRKVESKGHFFSYSKREGFWFEFNDEIITKKDSLDFLHTDEAYLLFYEHQK